MVDADYEQFLAWKSANEAAAVNANPDAPRPTIEEVLVSLIRSARLPNEEIQRIYEEVIRDHFGEKTENTAVDTDTEVDTA